MKTPLASLPLAVALTTGAAPKDQPADLVVHEWGTFTSVQAADGKQVPWLSKIGADLPNFVYLDRNPNSIGAGYLSRSTLGKFTRYARQRMETPVLYFYSDKPMNVDIEVGFPLGSIT